ncbi:MAG: Bug family tripartite tricarboxylate transporter substrate binding protein [Burkholderiales bacterium]
MNHRMLCTAVLALLFAGCAAAQTNYPEKAVRVIVAYPAGGAPDIMARIFGPKLADALGKPVVIENVTGVTGSIGADRVAKAAPDGYTLGFQSIAELAIGPGLSKMSYDPLKDFSPISQVGTGVPVLVVPSAVPAKTLQELVKLAKARPGELSYASSGSGTSPHLTAELLKSAAGVDILHIPYKGAVLAIPDMLAGRITMMFAFPQFVMPLVREGKLRALAVTSATRTALLPDVPTVVESGYPGFDVTAWYGLTAPAKTSPAIVARLHAETVKALAHPEVRAKFADVGNEAVSSSPAEFTALIKSETLRWAKVIKDAGIKAD